MKKCTVIGGGAMGRQIALNTAIHGYEVAVCESFPSALESLESWKETYLAGRVEKGRMTQEQVDAVKARFSVTDDLATACRDADIVIEAIIEDKQAKLDLLSKVSDLVRPDTIIATNSSYMVSSTFAGVVTHPERLANLHYFMPALVMKLVEVVKGEHTSQETVDKLMQFGRDTGKTPALVQKEEDGFIVNNILNAIKEEAYRLVAEGVCTSRDLDTAVKLGLGHPMGPFELDDMSGVDVRYNVLKRRYEEKGVKSNGYDMIEKLVCEGRLGKKVKHGFYDYE
ncbi:MAG: 3-hydroxyacyl-CoA dehydrogenase family protein [Oscillospiraceae bacterium]|nr:3-hydroxyacyl-CoA dehydrogenase family protein [Oscillospiraceae bacterium]